VLIYFLNEKQGYTTRKMDIVYTDKCWYEIRNKKKFWYGIYQPISSTDSANV
jgi:hypothetical protein